MALALLGELVLFKRVLRIALFALALLLSYSGTGLLALFIGLLFPLGRRTIVQLFVLLGIGGLVVWLLGDVLNLSFTLGRVKEFGSEHSSAYIRYIAPIRLIHDSLDTDAWTALLGHGPGAIQRTTQGYQFHGATWAKLIFEYGLLGFVAFLVLVMAALNQRLMPIQVRAALFFCWLIMGGHLLTPENTALMLALVGFWTKSGECDGHADNHALHFANVGRDYTSARPNSDLTTIDIMNAAAPRISIAITCFDYAQYVGLAIESAIRQAYMHKETIVVYDGWTDNSSEVIARYAVRVRTSNNRIGVGSQHASWLQGVDWSDRRLSRCR